MEIVNKTSFIHTVLVLVNGGARISKEILSPQIIQRRLDPGKETLEGFFQVGNQKEYQNVVIISFVHLEKVNIFCFMHKSVAQKLSLPCPFESQTLNSHKSANFKARDFSFWI